jgi:predicted acetyltransferase
MKQFETKRVLFGVLAALAVGLIFLPAELRHHSKHPAGIEQNKARLIIHNKLSGLDRKAASAEWFMHQRNYPLGYIPENAEIRALEDMRAVFTARS